MSGRKRALVSGYGIAGAAITHWLIRAGWEVTVIERSDGIRSSGNPVDVRGEAVDALRAMGCYEEVRERDRRHPRGLRRSGRSAHWALADRTRR